MSFLILSNGAFCATLVKSMPNNGFGSEQMMPKLAFAIIFSLVFLSASHAQVACGAQPGDVPPDVVQRIQGDVEGKAQIFSRLLGDSDIKGKVDTSRSEVHQKYKDIDKSQIDKYMAWVSCQTIMSDNTLNSPQKIDLWIKVYRELKPGSSEKKSQKEEELLDVFQKIPVGSSSKEYVHSLLGTPRIADSVSETFDLRGYKIEVGYVGKEAGAQSKPSTVSDDVSAQDTGDHSTNPSLSENIVSSIKIEKSDLDQNIDEDVSLKANWNQSYCGCLMFKETARIDDLLSDVIVNRCNNVSYDNDTFVCSVESDSGNNEVDVNFFLQYGGVNNATLMWWLYKYASDATDGPTQESALDPTEARNTAAYFNLPDKFSAADLEGRIQKELGSSSIVAIEVRLAPKKPKYIPDLCEINLSCKHALSQVN